MTEPLRLRLESADQPLVEFPLDAPIELGRQRDASEPEPFHLVPATLPIRLIIARRDDKDNVSRRHLTLEPLANGTVRVTNHSKLPLSLPGAGQSVVAGTMAVLPAPFTLPLPGCLIHILPAESLDESGIEELSEQTRGPASLLHVRASPPADISVFSRDQLEHWLHSTMSVVQCSIGSADFLAHAARVLVDVVGLNAGRVLLFDGEAWRVAATSNDDVSPDWRPSDRILQRLREQKKTFWQRPHQASRIDTPSLYGLDKIVAAPLLDAADNVIGALYGERRQEIGQRSRGGSRLEAILVDLIACGVSAGLARQKVERAALEARIQFEQFFTPQLAEQMRRDPSMLAGRDADVTLLFADVRGFSRFSERLGPQQTVAWMNDVMSTLSECILAEEGVLVDYIGDELLAMWGAPTEQLDHSRRGVRAALAMADTLPLLNEKWSPILGEPMNVGIGLNSGPAQVGNTGSRFKFKYGPLGNTVNLASRVQGLTKYLKCRLLVTAATRRTLGDEFITRRVVKTRVVNIREPVDLFEVRHGSPVDEAFFAQSEAALDKLEHGDFVSAARVAGTVLQDHAGDGPMLLVLSRAATQLVQGGDFDTIWEPPGK